jgi:hypothetical protein
MFEVHIEGVLSKPDLVLAIKKVLATFDDLGTAWRLVNFAA